MTDEPIQKVYIKDDEDVKVYENIKQAIRIAENRLRVELVDGQRAKKDGRLIAVVGDWDIWTHYPNGVVDDSTMEGYEDVPRAFELPQGGVLVYEAFGDTGDSVCGQELRRVKRAD